MKNEKLEQAEREIEADRKCIEDAEHIVKRAKLRIAANEARVESLRSEERERLKAVPLRLWVLFAANGDWINTYDDEDAAKAVARAGRDRRIVPMVEVTEGWQCRGPYTREEIHHALNAWHRMADYGDAATVFNRALGFGGGK